MTMPRLIRKGTFSCWECKRRKTRCEFKPESSQTCVFCQRRGKKCIGQQYDEPVTRQNPQVERRVNAIESLVDQLVQQKSDRRTQLKEFKCDHYLRPTIPSPINELLLESPSLSKQLHAFLPHPSKAAILLTHAEFLPVPVSAIFKTQLDLVNQAQLCQAADFPLPTAHPIRFARKLIELALCLHQLDPPIYDVARCYVEIASRLVTSQTFLMESIEGIETLMLESLYYVDLGDIRNAWLVVRRGISIAQVINLPQLAARGKSREKHAWSRLLLGDQSLSWMLGLPLAITDDTLCSEQELKEHAWDSTLKSLHSKFFMQIIRRNSCIQRQHRDYESELDYNSYDDQFVTQEIDRELKQTARSLSTDWWKCPTLNSKLSQGEIMERTGKLMVQMYHHLLLIMLHQPYFLRTPTASRVAGKDLSLVSPFTDTYSQFAVLSASREFLSRFLILRSFHRRLPYRGIDDKVFPAAMMLLLVHLDASRLGHANALEHQRPQDLSLVGEVISLLEETSSANKDKLSSSMASGLRRLQEIEKYATDGCSYSICIQEDLSDGQGCLEIVEVDGGLSVPIPYFGCIRIAPSNNQEFQVSHSSDSASLESQPCLDADLSTITQPGIFQSTHTAASLDELNHDIDTKFLDSFLNAEALLVNDLSDDHIWPIET